MTTKIDSPQPQEQTTQQQQPADGKAPAVLVIRALLAATAPLFRRAISSAFAIRLGSLREEDYGAIEELEGTLEDEGPAEGSETARRTDIQRFDLHQRIQHVLMFTSFITLAVTGLPQKFHTVTVSQWLIATFGGIETTQTIHHVAAFVMIFDCAYHGAYIVYGILKKRDINPLRMIPTPKDMADAVQMFLYFLGFSKKQPRFDRYSYLEKFDYWAVFWGIVIIGGSGLVLLFPVQLSRVLPGPLIPVALAAHSDEAVLAVGWIFVVHLFYAHMAPRIFPFNTSIFTGKISRERYREEHPLDYRRILVAERRRQLKVEATTPAAPAAELPVAGGAPETGTTEVATTVAGGDPPAASIES